MNEIFRNFELRKYILRAINSKNIKETKEYINFRCNICGDSKKSKTKKRGYILKSEKKWYFKCHNCNAKMPADVWLKKYYYTLYKSYLITILQNEKKENKEQEKEKYKNLKISKKKKEKITDKIIPIKKGKTDIFEVARKYCINRKIPENIWEKWFVSVKGKFGGRLIIPFYNKNNKIVYFQGRTLCGQTPKYLNKVGDKKIYNIDFVNANKPIIVTEGPIDSLFIENSISILGKDISILKDYDYDFKFIFDNDKTGNNTAKNLLKYNISVFNWNKFLSDNKINEDIKDINDLILLTTIKKLKYENIKKYFVNSLYDSIYF